MIKSLLFAAGACVVFVYAVEGYYASVREISGLRVADHAMSSCPSWGLGLVTGAAAVGLVWWAWLRG